MSPGAQYVYESRRFMDREEDNFRIGGEAPDFQGSLCATQNRHIDVEENDVRLEFEDLVDGFLTVLRLTADLKTMPIQKRADRDPCRLMIVNNKDSCWHRLRPVFRHRNGGTALILGADTRLYNTGNTGTAGTNPVWIELGRGRNGSGTVLGL
jgi:hypothetical protein